MSNQHVKDIKRAFCCPYDGCPVIYYEGRESEIKRHLKQHEEKIERKERTGQGQAMPLSTYHLSTYQFE